MGFSVSAISAGAALIALVFLGLGLLLALAAYALLATVVAIVPVTYVDAKYEWNAGGVVLAFPIAFLVASVAAFALDLTLGSYVSVPAMIDAFDLVRWEYARPEPLVRSVLDYYAVALGPTRWTWLRFLAIQIVMVVVFATVLWALFRKSFEEEIEPTPPLRRGLRMLGLSAVAIGTSAAVAFPLFVQLVIWLRGFSA
jgi:hypothetical protein